MNLRKAFKPMELRIQKYFNFESCKLVSTLLLYLVRTLITRKYKYVLFYNTIFLPCSFLIKLRTSRVKQQEIKKKKLKLYLYFD